MGLPPEQAPQITDRFEQLSSTGDFWEQQCQTVLFQIEELKETMLTEAGTVDFALIRLDQIEFEPKQRLVGIVMQLLTLIKELGIILQIEPNTEDLQSWLRSLNVPIDGGGGITIKKIR